jgi:hypothetical protein
MAAQLYPKAREAFLNGEMNWLADEFRAVLIDKNFYAVDFTNDEFLTDIPATAVIATSAPLTGTTSTNGVADADDITTESLSGDELITALVIIKDTGVPGTSRLVAYTDSGIGFPLTQSGGPVQIRWSDGPYRIFVL